MLAAAVIAAAMPIMAFAAPFPQLSLPFSWLSFSRTNDGPQIAQIVYPQYPSAPDSGVNSNESLNWAGYVSTEGSFTAVGGTWTIPSVPSANRTSADATWVGIGGVTGHNLIQAGTQAITDPNGSVRYAAWYELLPDDMQQISFPVHAGDSISVSLEESDPGTWRVSYRNNTTGDTDHLDLSYNSDHSSAEWIQEMPSSNVGTLPLDNFGSISFSEGAAAVNGVHQTIAQTGAKEVTMISRNGSVLAAPSPLGNDGASFTVSRAGGGQTVTVAIRRFVLPPSQILDLLRSRLIQLSLFRF